MAAGSLSFGSLIFVSCLVLLTLPSPAAAFGAGNIPSIAQIEGNNFRHGGMISHVLADGYDFEAD